MALQRVRGDVGLRTRIGNSPSPSYLGYDQAKAGQAAARADTLERERRRLAMERAGLGEGRPSPSPSSGPAPLAGVANGGRVRRLSVDAAAANVDEGRLAHGRSSDDLPRIRPLRG